MPTTPWSSIKRRYPGTYPVRDPDRIEAIVVALRTLWVKYPDLRFGQIVRYIQPGGGESRDAYYIEDEEWLSSLLEILNKDKPF